MDATYVILKKRLSQLAVVVLVGTILPYIFFPLMPHSLFVVATDSMSPAINRGDLVILSHSRIANGSIIVFKNPLNHGYEAHRICGTQEVGNRTYYVTKGDAVNHTDSFLTPQENVVGIVRAKIPYVGLYYLIPRYLALLITMSLILFYVTTAFYENRRRNSSQEQEGKTTRNTKRKTKPQRTKKPKRKKMRTAALALFLISMLFLPPAMLAGVNLVYPGSQHPATVTTPKIELQNGIEGSSTIGDGGNSATVTVDGSYHTVPWWDTKYDHRRKVTVNEPNRSARTYEPVEVTLNFDQGKCYSKDTVRVAYWDGGSWSEIDSQVFDVTLWGDNTVRQATVLWLADVEVNSSKDYYIYYDEDGEVSAPSYTGLAAPSVVNRGTSFNLTTTYGTGDTIEVNGTYGGVEKLLVWINLKHNPTSVAWDDWYINPGIFHLWVDGADVFQGGPQTGEAQTGTHSHHSDKSNYAQKGNATAVEFQVVGPLLIRINITYARFTHAGNLNVDFEDVFYIYYTPDHLTTTIKVRHTDKVKTSFVEADWGDWYHMDYPSWDVTPTQTKLAYHTTTGTKIENLAPGSFSAHYDWDERWVAMLDDVNVEPALGFFFISDSQHTIDTTNFGVENVGGQNDLWGIGWFPRWSVGSTVPAASYTQVFWWTAKKTNQTQPIRNEYIKTVNPLERILGAEVNNHTPQSYANLGSTTNDGAPIGNLQSSDDQYVTFTAYQSWWNPNYMYRRKITITNPANSTLPPSYSVKITVDTTGPKFLDNGDDLRMVYTVTNTELDRVNETAFNAVDTEIWFKTQAGIPAGGEDDSYYMYYGYSGAGTPLANRNQVYLWFDDFSTNTTNNYDIDRHANDWHGSASNIYKPYWDSTNHAVYYDTGDNYAGGWMPNAINETNVYAEMKMKITGSYPINTTNGILLRWQNKDTFYGGHISGDSYESPCLVKNGRTNYIEYGSPSEYHVWNQWFTLAVAMGGTNLKLWVDGVQKVSGTDTQITNSGKISFMAAQSQGWMDDFKVRKYVDPEPSTSLSSEEITWWNTDYRYRKKITVTAGSAPVPSGYSVSFTENTSSLISAGKLRSDGKDFRVLYWNGTAWIELDRDIHSGWNTTSTVTLFKLQAGIAANSSDSNYYLYYGYSDETGSPPANKSNVYDFWDDFDDASLDPAWTFSQIGGASGSVSESGTVVTLNATTSGDLWGTSDSFLFLSISSSYDVLVESYTSGWGGSHDTWSKMGGVQLRQSLDANSTNRIMSPVYSAVGATNSYRLSTGGSTSEETTSTQPKYNRLMRIGGTSRAWYSVDRKSWTELGSQISFSGGLSDPVRIGIHLAGLSSSSHWVEVDWFKVRKYVEPEPTTSVGSEEKTSEYTADWYCSFAGVSLSNVVRFTITFEGQYSNASVAQKLHLYSFTDSAWVLFDTFTTSSTPSTDEARKLNLTSDLSKYVSSGEVRLRVQAVKNTGTQFQCKADYVNLVTTKAYDYVLRVYNQVGYAWSMFLTRSSDSNITRLSNVTIWLHNSDGMSKQIQIISGSYTQTSGNPYSLAAGGADYLAISAIASTTGTSEISVYLKAEIPSSGILIQLPITFEIA